MTPPLDPTLIEVGRFAIHWYGIFVVTGILLGASVASYLAKQAGANPDDIWDLLIFAVALGIVGARLEYVLTPPHWTYYKQNPLEILQIWQGGLRIYGAIIGGGAAVIGYALARRFNPLHYLDFSAPGMAIGQAIGRWGNYINQELYGPPTDLPWGLHIPPSHRLPPYNDLQRYPVSTRFHPAFLYESLANLALCLLLIWVFTRYREYLKTGDLTVFYLIGYAIIRFFMEALRTDGTSAQALSLIFIAVGIGVLIVRHWPGTQAETVG
jgi:phosphatidylglycerol:prolipoprotein diacylglycerol transferase